MQEPLIKDHYHPLNDPRYYPLELTKDLHICLWDEEGKYKWTIAYIVQDPEDGSWLKCVGDRMMNARVDWTHFKDLIKLGFHIANHRWTASERFGDNPLEDPNLKY